MSSHPKSSNQLLTEMRMFSMDLKQAMVSMNSDLITETAHLLADSFTKMDVLMKEGGQFPSDWVTPKNDYKVSEPAGCGHPQHPTATGCVIIACPNYHKPKK